MKTEGSLYWHVRGEKDVCRAARIIDGKRFVADAEPRFCGCKAKMSSAEIRLAENSALTRLQDTIDSYAPRAERLTVAQWVAHDTRGKLAAGKIEESTSIRYDCYRRLYIEGPQNAPYPIGRAHLAKLTGAQCREHFERLASEGVTSSMRAETFKMLNASLVRARRKFGLPRNPLEEIERVTHEKQHRDPMHPSFLGPLVTALEGHRYEGVFWIAMTRGYRISEIIGLRWSDFEFTEGTLSLRTQLYRPKGRGHAPIHKKLKAKNSQSDAVQHPYVLELLARLKLRATSDFIFENAIGGALQTANFRNRQWYPLLTAAGLPRVAFHTFRNTAATMFELGNPRDPRGVRDFLRHATDAQTSEYLGRRRTVEPEKLGASDRYLDGVLSRVRALKEERP